MTATGSARERRNERQRLWRAANPEKVRSARKRNRLKYPGKHPAEVVAWKQANPEQARAIVKKSIAKNLKTNQARWWRNDIKRRMSPSAKRALLERVRAISPKSLSSEEREEFIGMMLEAVYAGRFPRRIKPDHAEELMVERFHRSTPPSPERTSHEDR